MPGDRIKLNLKINNLSKNDYEYVENSFLLSTESFDTNLTDIKGFDSQDIPKLFIPYKSYNTALQKLFNNKEVNANDLSEENIDILLKEKNYNGYEDLDKYFLNFYNQKYNLTSQKLEDFSDKIIMEIFNGNMYEVKETNKNIIELSYNWFYNKLFSMNYENEIVTDSNSQDFSIGKHMRNKAKDNLNFKNTFGIVKANQSNELNNMSLNINGLYTVNTFLLYNFSAHMEFKLKNTNSTPVNKEENKKEEVITPPNTNEENNYQQIFLLTILLLITLAIRKKIIKHQD